MSGSTALRATSANVLPGFWTTASVSEQIAGPLNVKHATPARSLRRVVADQDMELSGDGARTFLHRTPSADAKLQPIIEGLTASN